MALRLDEIRAAAVRVAASHGLDVVDIEFVGSARDRVLRVFLEMNAEGRARLQAGLAAAAAGKTAPRPAETGLSPKNVLQLSGVTHENLAAFSREFGTLIDVEDLVPGAAYTLEASSPGLDRKLTRLEDFERFLGCLVKVRTFEPVRNNRHWQGRLVAGPGTGTGAAAGMSITLDLAAGKPAAGKKPKRQAGVPNDRSSSLGQKAGFGAVEIAFANIERAQLVPEI